MGNNDLLQPTLAGQGVDLTMHILMRVEATKCSLDANMKDGSRSVLHDRIVMKTVVDKHVDPLVFDNQAQHITFDIINQYTPGYHIYHYSPKTPFPSGR